MYVSFDYVWSIFNDSFAPNCTNNALDFEISQRKHPSLSLQTTGLQPTNPPPKAKPSFLSRLMQRATGRSGGRDIYANAHKIDPKVYFSVERTYLAWMHTAILLAGIAMAMMDYSEEGDDTAFYGLLLLPVGIAFILYAMYQCKLLNRLDVLNANFFADTCIFI